MAEQKTSVGWEPAFFIWWNQVWRFAAVNVFLIILYISTLKLTPIVNKNLTDFIPRYEGTTIIVLIVFECLVHLWTIRQSFVNSYTTFLFAAESKLTKRSLFHFRTHLGWGYVFAIWFEQMWRMLLIPGAIIGGGLAATLAKHPGAANYFNLLDNNLTKLNLYAAFVLSVWATKESLGDRYRTFIIIAKAQTLYQKN